MRVEPDELAALTIFLRKLRDIRFHGKIEITYQDGHANLIKTTEYVKPETLVIAMQQVS